jgi:hypothetical protein
VSKTALGFLVENEFIEWSAREQKYRPTKLAKACVASALSPEEGLVRQCPCRHGLDPNCH